MSPKKSKSGHQNKNQDNSKKDNKKENKIPNDKMVNGEKSNEQTRNEEKPSEGTRNEETKNEGTRNEDTQNEGTRNEDTQNEGTRKSDMPSEGPSNTPASKEGTPHEESPNDPDSPPKKNDTDEGSAIERYIKHPLQDTWTLWYFQNDKSLDWKKNQLEIATFSYIEDFWSLHEHIKKASELKQGTDYSLFKKGITPMWEDPVNKSGGRWIVNQPRGQKQELDKAWLDILLLLIGNTLDHNDQVCGAVVNIRFKGDKIGVWTRDYMAQTAVMEIGREIKEALNIPYSNTLKYEAHIDSMDKKNYSARYTV